MRRILILIIISIFLAGCNNGKYNKVMEMAKSELASGEFDKALTSFKLALDEKPNDEEAKTSYENLLAYNQVKEAIESAKWDDALTKANTLLKKETLVSSIKNELEKYVEISKANKKQHKVVSEELEAKIKAEASASKKNEYIQKLNNIEEGLADLKHLYDGPTVGMVEAALETHKRWDNALNDIYGVLKKQLSANEMSLLKEKQVKWIKYRDDTAKTDSLQFKGGTLEPLEYRLSLANSTKKRCFELVEIYIK